MNLRRVVIGAGAAALLAAGVLATPVSAGVQAPHDMIASPNTGPVGTHVTISNAANSPCGGQQGDGEAQVDLLINPPDNDDSATSVTPDEDGNWEVVYLDTQQVGTYTVVAECLDVTAPSSHATDFDYSTVTFVITAAEPTTTTTGAPTTTSTAAPAAAVGATAAFTG